jgi:hypothetical protein
MYGEPTDSLYDDEVGHRDDEDDFKAPLLALLAELPAASIQCLVLPETLCRDISSIEPASSIGLAPPLRPPFSYQLRQLDISAPSRDTDDFNGMWTQTHLECFGHIPTLTHFTWKRRSADRQQHHLKIDYDFGVEFGLVTRTDLFHALTHLKMNVTLGGPVNALILFGGSPLESIELISEDEFWDPHHRRSENGHALLYMHADAEMFAPFASSLKELRLSQVTGRLTTLDAYIDYLRQLHHHHDADGASAGGSSSSSSLLRELRLTINFPIFIDTEEIEKAIRDGEARNPSKCYEFRLQRRWNIRRQRYAEAAYKGAAAATAAAWNTNKDLIAELCRFQHLTSYCQLYMGDRKGTSLEQAHTCSMHCRSSLPLEHHGPYLVLPTNPEDKDDDLDLDYDPPGYWHGNDQCIQHCSPIYALAAAAAAAAAAPPTTTTTTTTIAGAGGSKIVTSST